MELARPGGRRAAVVLATLAALTVAGCSSGRLDPSSGAQVKGTTQLPGREIPTPDGFGDGVADYTLSGDTLTVTFSGPAVGTVTQTYRRGG